MQLSDTLRKAVNGHLTTKAMICGFCSGVVTALFPQQMQPSIAAISQTKSRYPAVSFCLRISPEIVGRMLLIFLC